MKDPLADDVHEDWNVVNQADRQDFAEVRFHADDEDDRHLKTPSTVTGPCLMLARNAPELIKAIWAPVWSTMISAIKSPSVVSS